MRPCSLRRMDAHPHEQDVSPERARVASHMAYRNELHWIEFWVARSGELLLHVPAFAHTDDRVVLINRGD